MCQIIIKPEGLLTNIPNLDRAQARNKDGCGVMWYDGESIKVYKTLDYELFKEVIINNVKEYPAVIHLRLASKGKVTLDNVHPYETAQNGYLCHNGTISQWGCDNDSDTRELATLLKDLEVDFDKEVTTKLIYKVIGTTYNKVVVMTPDGKLYIYNDNLFIEEDGILYSNTSHQEYKPVSYIANKNKRTNYWDDVYDEDDYLPFTYKYKSKETYKVFVYGTLKSGQSNHHLLKDSKFLGKAKTILKYAMVDNFNSTYPYMLGVHKDGFNIEGEVYEVDEGIKKVLDALEGVPSVYIEDEITVKLDDSNTCIKAICYVKSSTARHPSIIDTVYNKKDFLSNW